MPNHRSRSTDTATVTGSNAVRPVSRSNAAPVAITDGNCHGVTELSRNIANSTSRRADHTASCATRSVATNLQRENAAVTNARLTASSLPLIGLAVPRIE